MPARKIPLVWKTQKESDQTYFKFSHTSQRVVQVGCDCPTAAPPPPPCTPPDPADSVTLSNLTATGGDISFVYGGTETQFWVTIYESPTLPVNTSPGTEIFNIVGALTPSGQTYVFPTVLNNYYVAGLRVRKDCGGGIFENSTYVYSDPVQYTGIQPFQYIRVGGGIGNPGLGNFCPVVTTPPNVVLQFSTTDKNSQDATTFLSTQLASATTIIVTKDPSNYSIFTRNSNNNFGLFWAFNCTISSFLGIVGIGDTVTVTYT
jgi:hypothetical protein